MEKAIVQFQSPIKAPRKFTAFLWWLSTAEKELLQQAVVDGNRHRIVGMTVLATWAFATLAWTYFFSTVAVNLWAAVPLGFFMGFIILTIDRALIKGINKNAANKIWPLAFRGLLAITIGTFMAQPALLYLFNKEIKLQTSLDNEKRKLLNATALNSFYQPRKLVLQTEKNNLQKEVALSSEEVSNARDNFLAETDGSGGTGRVGVKAVALAKKLEYQKLDTAYQILLGNQQPKITAIETELNSIDATIKKEAADFAQYFNTGFLTQIEALNNLIKNNSALQFRYYLLVMILLLIELMPVIAKSLLPSGTYEEKARLQEAMEKALAQDSIEKEQQLKEKYLAQKNKYDAEMMTIFFEVTRVDRLNKINQFSHDWSNSSTQSFDDLLEQMKRTILSKEIL